MCYFDEAYKPHVRTRHFSILAQLWLANASSKATNDPSNANGGVVIAAAYINDAVDAAKQVDVKSDIIREGETIFRNVLGLANKGTLN